VSLLAANAQMLELRPAEYTSVVARLLERVVAIRAGIVRLGEARGPRLREAIALDQILFCIASLDGRRRGAAGQQQKRPCCYVSHGIPPELDYIPEPA